MTATSSATRAPLQLTAPWGGCGWMSDLGGQPVHWVDFGGPDPAADGSSGAPVVMVHGLGGSHLNWVLVAPALTARHHVYAVDLAGFGLTAGTPHTSVVRSNADLLALFLTEVVGGPAVLVGNSMGGMVSMLLADSRPDLVRALVLVDPSIPVPRQIPDAAVFGTFLVYATPFLGEQYMRRMTRRMTDRQRVQSVVDLCFADPGRADPKVLDAGVALSAYRRGVPGQEAAFIGAARSLVNLLATGRTYRAVIRRLAQPALLVHGDRDRLVPIAAARQVAALQPGWDTAYLEGVGHTPQLEVPRVFLDRVEPWLARLPSTVTSS